MIRLLFSGLVALILLGFYVYATLYGIQAAHCLSHPDCTAYTAELTEGVATVLELVGGLVSALVVAELAVTQPGQPPARRLLATNASPLATKTLMVVSVAYLLVWLATGVASLVVGYIQHPGLVPALTSTAKAWLGLAVAAGYSYFGISR